MTPTWTSPDGRVVLYCGDCLAVLPTLAAGSVDAVVTDPPYGIAHESNHGASWRGRMIDGDDDSVLRDLMRDWAEARHLAWAMFGSWKVRPPLWTRACLVWDKGPASGMGDLSLPWKPSWEEIYIGGIGWSGRRDEGVLRGPCMITWETAGRTHPNEKPVWLMVHMLEKLPEVVRVFDPFMGSGTTGVACVRTGRRFIGIEIDPHYFAIAKRRIEAELAQPQLPFAAPATPPDALDL